MGVVVLRFAHPRTGKGAPDINQDERAHDLHAQLEPVLQVQLGSDTALRLEMAAIGEIRLEGKFSAKASEVKAVVSEALADVMEGFDTGGQPVSQSDPSATPDPMSEIKAAREAAQKRQRTVQARFTAIERILHAHTVIWREEPEVLPSPRRPMWPGWTGYWLVFIAGLILNHWASLGTNFDFASAWFYAGIAIISVGIVLLIAFFFPLSKDLQVQHSVVASSDVDRAVVVSNAVAVGALRDALVWTASLEDLRLLQGALERRLERRAMFAVFTNSGWLTQLGGGVAVIAGVIALSASLQTQTWLGGGSGSLGQFVLLLAGVYALVMTFWGSALADATPILQLQLRAATAAIAEKTSDSGNKPSATN